MRRAGRSRRLAGLPLLVACALAGASSGTGPRPARPGPPTLPLWSSARGDERFQSRLAEALARIQATQAGGQLLGALAHAGRRVVFRPSALPSDFTSGFGEPTIVWWNPDFESPQSPAFVSLQHELVHALQRAGGDLDGGGWTEDEAVGLGRCASLPYSENALRSELGLPHRASHDGLPGFTVEAVDRLYLAAYSDRDLTRRRAALEPAHVSVFETVDARIPRWVEQEGL